MLFIRTVLKAWVDFRASTREVVKPRNVFHPPLFLVCISALSKIEEASHAQQKLIDAGQYALWWCFVGAVGISILQTGLSCNGSRL